MHIQHNGESECISVLERFVEVHSSTVISFNLRLSHGIRKISSALHGIETLLSSADVELDDLMKEREQKMNSEFARRFSRNNLYPIHLQISKLENEIVSFHSNKYCKISKATVLRALILSLVSHLSHSTQIYEKFLRKSKLKCVFKIDDLMDYLRLTFQMMKYIVDTSCIESLDVSQTIALVLKLSIEQKRKFSSVDLANKNKIISRNKKIRSKLLQDRKRHCIKNELRPVNIPTKTAVTKNVANKRLASNSTSNSLSCQMKRSNKNSICIKNGNKMKLQTIYFELCNKLMDELLVEVSNDMTECISNLITDAYKRELVNVNLQ